MDADLAVIHKPAGMVVHPGAGVRSPTLVHALLALHENWSLVGGRSRPGIVHRLDRDTSGLIVVARNDATHRALSAQFGRREVEKTYEAVVFGHPEATRGRISAPIARDARARSRMAVRDAGRPSETRFEVRERFPHLALLTVRPLTGRTHQIRVHLAALGHPVAIDPLYGGTARLRALPEGAARLALAAFGRLALHARALSFTHPADGKRVTFVAPLPEDLAELIEALRSMAP
jgi:23S rRNA pseudouridine1911/1915/1917 synthase